MGSLKSTSDPRPKKTLQGSSSVLLFKDSSACPWRIFLSCPLVSSRYKSLAPQHYIHAVRRVPKIYVLTFIFQHDYSQWTHNPAINNPETRWWSNANATHSSFLHLFLPSSSSYIPSHMWLLYDAHSGSSQRQQKLSNKNSTHNGHWTAKMKINGEEEKETSAAFL